MIRPNKKISVFSTVLGKRVGTHIYIFFLEKYNFTHFERNFAFQNA